MFYANFLFTCGLTIILLSVYTCRHTAYGALMMVTGLIAILIGTVVAIKTEHNDNMKKTLKESRFKELERLVEAQSEQINSLREEIEILKHR